MKFGLGMAAALMAIAPLAVVRAAPGDWVAAVKPIATPAEPRVIDLPVTQPRAAGGPEAWAAQTPDQRILYNINQPQIIALPSSLPKTATAPAVLLVPGGGFLFLAMDNEGYDVARRLDRLGVRVFIVKYRTLPIAGGFDGFKAALTQLFVKGERPSGDDRPYAVADTQAAIRTVRARAAEWHVDPAKIGVLGFSAGAMTVLATLQAGAADAPVDFAGLIYGPTSDPDGVPAKAPPLFAAIAADDRFFKGQDLSLIHGWRQAGSSVELHLYSGGGHGFASHPNGTTSDAWFDQYALWLKAGGVLPQR